MISQVSGGGVFDGLQKNGAKWLRVPRLKGGVHKNKAPSQYMQSKSTTQSGAVKAQNGKKIHPRYFVTAFNAVVGVVGMGLSLFHLSHGLHAMTGDSMVFSWALAIVIDLGILAAKSALIVSKVERLDGVKQWAVPYLCVAMVFSSALNAQSLASGQEILSLGWFFCVGLGCFTTSAVFVLGNIVAGLLVARRLPDPPSQQEAELRKVVQAVDAAKGDKAKAADGLGLSVRHLNRRLQDARSLNLV